MEMLRHDNDYSLGWCTDFYWFTRIQVQNNQQVHELLSHEWINKDMVAIISSLLKAKNGYFGSQQFHQKLFLFPVKILEVSITLLQCIE